MVFARCRAQDPERYAHPPMPKARFSHRAYTVHSLDEVWERLQRVETWANIGPVEEVWSAVHGEDGSLRSYRWSAHVGPTRYKGTATVVAAEKGRLMTLDLDGAEVTGVLTTTILPNGHRTSVAVTLEIASNGTLSSLFFPLVAQAVGKSLPDQVDRFVAALDAPE